MEPSISLLCHTFNKYEQYWDGYLKGFSANFFWDVPCYFGTDTEAHGSHDFDDLKVIYSGDAEWSDRLIALLSQIDTEYVFYTQEDQWFKDCPPDMETMMWFVRHYGLWRLQISPVAHFYSLTGSNIPLFFKNHPKSKYLVSHQPSIWKKSFLLECLKPGENPWVNEYKGSIRLNQRTDIDGKIAIYPCNWYRHTVENGKFIG